MNAADWQGRARREAAAILASCEMSPGRIFDYDDVIGLLAIAWLQGTNFGSHEALRLAEQAFDNLVTELTTP